MMENKQFRPGENCPKTGKYTEYSSKGKIILEDIMEQKYLELYL